MPIRLSRLLSRYQQPLRRAVIASSITALLSGALQAGAATTVFHSPNDDGLPDAGTASVSEGGLQPVYLYIDGGAAASAPGTPCDTGAGDEVCGFDLHLTGLAGLTLSSFSADGGADLVTNLSAGELRINGLDSQTPTTGPVRIGELVVAAVAGGALELTSGEVVGADLAGETLTPGTLVIVPEPGIVASLVSAAALLAFLERRRAAQ